MKRYNKTIAGRVSPGIRNQIRPVLKQFARKNQMPFNTVFGAVIQVAEALPGRVTHERVLALVNLETVQAYRLELARVRDARLCQIAGMARKALPAGRRNSGEVQKIMRLAEAFEGSIPELHQHIRQLAGGLTTEGTRL